jgi:cyanuric acid amidohydrolase
MAVNVLTYDTAHPGDTNDLLAKLSRFNPDRIKRLALLAKTEGNAELNDYSREFALLGTTIALRTHGGEALVRRTTFLFSTGCEGAITPFGYLFVDYADEDGAQPKNNRALVIGRARSRSLQQHEIGKIAHADIVAATVDAAIADAGVSSDDVALVIVKTPVAGVPQSSTVGANTPITSGQSKAIGALGAGIALGEVDRNRLLEFSEDPLLYARRAMVFSGTEFESVEVLLLANKRGAAGDLTIHIGFMKDLLDASAIRRTFEAAGCRIEDGVISDSHRVAAVLLKVGVAADGRLRGQRTTIKSSHIDMDKQVRAATSGVIGSILGTTRSFISANTVHQAPPGGGLCACIVAGAHEDESAIS